MPLIARPPSVALIAWAPIVFYLFRRFRPPTACIIAYLGAYLLLFPRANVLTLIIFGFFVRIVRVPAVFVLGFWFVVQFVSGLVTWGAATARGEALGGETAWFAHLGGFLAGMVLLFALRPRNRGDGGPGRSW